MNEKLIIVLIVFLAIAGLAAVVTRLFRVGITLLGLAIILPILCSVLWGDGDVYVSKFASIFTPELEQQITDGYRFYKEQDSKDPILDYGQVEEYADGALSRIKNAIWGLFGGEGKRNQSDAVFSSYNTGSGYRPPPVFYFCRANQTGFLCI